MAKDLRTRAREVRKEHGWIELLKRLIIYFEYRAPTPQLKPKIKHYRSKRLYTEYQDEYGEAIPEMYKTILIDPQVVSVVSVPKMITHHNSKYGIRIMGGGWDTREYDFDLGYSDKKRRNELSPGICSIDSFGFYREVKRFVDESISWKETKVYELEQQQRQKKAEHRRHKMESLRASIQKEGYLNQRQLLQRGSNQVETYPEPAFGEVIINIGRDGQLIFEDGKHRFCLAKAMGLKKIPVRVFVRHSEWMKRYKKAIKTDTSARSNYIRHPDLETDLFNE